jgi:hypothetical protein
MGTRRRSRFQIVGSDSGLNKPPQFYIGTQMKRIPRPRYTNPLYIFALIALISFSSCNKETTVISDGEGRTSGSIPDTPEIMQVFALSQEPTRGMHLIISDASNNEDGFRLERKPQGDSFTFRANLPTNADHYDDRGVQRSTTYTYRIRAYNQYGNSSWSEEKTATSDGLLTGNPLLVYTTADAYVDSSSANSNFGARSYLNISGSSGYWGGREDLLILFSLPSLPSHAVQFKSAYLRLCEAGGGHTTYPGPITLYAGEVLDQWNENTVTWNTNPAAVFYSSTQYGTHNPNSVPCVSIDVSRTVSNWYSSVIPNGGFKLISTSQTYCSYYSREGYSTGSALLEVDYFW